MVTGIILPEEYEVVKVARCSRNFGQDDVTYCGPAVSVSPEIHAAVALNAMLETHTSNFHNSFF
jgi:hypothetical protein